MPHVTVQTVEEELTPAVEATLIRTITEAVVGVYGEWVRPHAAVTLHGVPRRRWSPSTGTPAVVTVGVREGAFQRMPDLPERLIPGLTDGVAAALGEPVRPHVTVTLVGIPAGREGVGGAPVGVPS